MATPSAGDDIESPGTGATEDGRSADGEVPLFAHLDGTLFRTDVSVESAFALVRQILAYAVLPPLWLLRGRAHVKRCIADRIALDVESLPYIEDFIAYLRDQCAAGRRLVLRIKRSDLTVMDAHPPHVTGALHLAFY